MVKQFSPPPLPTGGSFISGEILLDNFFGGMKEKFRYIFLGKGNHFEYFKCHLSIMSYQNRGLMISLKRYPGNLRNLSHIKDLSIILEVYGAINCNILANSGSRKGLGQFWFVWLQKEPILDDF